MNGRKRKKKKARTEKNTNIQRKIHTKYLNKRGQT